jgi:hypothetical protein
MLKLLFTVYCGLVCLALHTFDMYSDSLSNVELATEQSYHRLSSEIFLPSTMEQVSQPSDICGHTVSSFPYSTQLLDLTCHS